MPDWVAADRELRTLDRQMVGLPACVTEEHRNRRRRRFFAIQRIAPYDGSRLPQEADFFCAESRDLTAEGVSFLLASRPDFGSLVVAFYGPPVTAYAVAEVVHCTDVWVHPSGLVEPVADGRRSARPADRTGEAREAMVLVGCKFVGRLEASGERQGRGGKRLVVERAE